MQPPGDQVSKTKCYRKQLSNFTIAVFLACYDCVRHISQVLFFWNVIFDMETKILKSLSMIENEVKKKVKKSIQPCLLFLCNLSCVHNDRENRSYRVHLHSL